MALLRSFVTRPSWALQWVYTHSGDASQFYPPGNSTDGHPRLKLAQGLLLSLLRTMTGPFRTPPLVFSPQKAACMQRVC